MRPVSALFAALVVLFGLGHAQAAPQAKAKAAPQKTTTPADTRVWTIVRGEDTYVLRFAQPRDAEPIFAATCQPSARLLQITTTAQASKQFGSGDGVPLSLASGKRRLELAATAFKASNDGSLVVEAAVTLDPRVFDLFRAGDQLNVKLPGENQTYPLAGAKARLADFERVCLARR